MLHPNTELRFVSPEIGYGIFATSTIPKGTITWVKDELDRTFTEEEVRRFTPENFQNLMKYTYRDKRGNFLFCWDLTRYINHSFSPNSMITGLDFEIAIRDILPGEEITNDYGTLNIIEPFKCAKDAHIREFVRPDDLKTYHQEWDKLVASAMEFLSLVKQPLSSFLTKEQKVLLSKIKSGEMELPSLIESYFEENQEIKC